MAKTSRPPWKRPNPRQWTGKKTAHLSPAKKATAKASARRAGRPYPNLVDNMRAASKKTSKKKKPARKAPNKSVAHKRVTSKTAKKPPARRSAKSRD